MSEQSEKFADALAELISEHRAAGLDRETIISELEMRLYAEREEEEG